MHRPDPASPPRTRILVIRAGALGDTLMATPVVTALRKRAPGATVDFLCSRTSAPLLELNDQIGEVYSLEGRNVPYFVSLEKRHLVRRLQAAQYATIVVLEQADRYYEIARRANPSEILGFHETPFDPRLHSVANNLRAAGFSDWQNWPQTMSLRLSPDDERVAADLLPPPAVACIAFHAGYGPRRSKRRQEHRLRGWRTAHFIDVGRRLIDRGFRIVVTGAPADRPLAETIAAGLPASGVVQLAGRTTVRQLAAVIRRMRVLLSVDSGPAHLAAALGTPLVVLWGPGILEQTRPLPHGGPVRIIRHPVPCAPCYGTPQMKTCRRNICMEGILPAEALAAIEAVTPTASS